MEDENDFDDVLEIKHKEKSTSEVILGYLDEKMQISDDNDKFATKTGGHPVWLLERTPKSTEVNLKCVSCNLPLKLLLQAYAPLSSYHHRVIYLFVCNNSKCSNSSEGWIALRAEIPVTEKELEDLQVQVPKAKEANNSKITNDSLKKETKKEEEDNWGIDKEEDNWGIDNGEWTEENDIDLNELLAKSKLNEETKSTNKESPSTSTSAATSSTSSSAASSILQKDEKKEQTSNKKTKVKLLDEQSYYEYRECFTPYYIYSELEPKATVVSFNKEKKLLQEYKKAIKSMQEQEEWASEQYESSPLDEKIFYKFQERIRRSPEQCIRYSGNPLYLSSHNLVFNDSSLGDPSIPNCEYCNSKRVFEMQVLPTLLSLENGNAVKMLQDIDKPRIRVHSRNESNSSESNSSDTLVTQIEETGIEFGTVCIFTCSNSCKSSSSSSFDYRKEFVFVQPAI